jgi:hypothetical protein
MTGGPRVRPLHKMHKQGRWPRFAADILPHGLEDTLRGLIAWLILDLPMRVAVTIITAFLVLDDACGVTILPYLCTSPTFIEKGYIRLIETFCDWTASREAPEPLAARYIDSVHLLLPLARLGHHLLGRQMDAVQCSLYLDKKFSILLSTGHAFDLCFRMVAHYRQTGDKTLERQTWAIAIHPQHVGARIYSISPEARTVPVSERASSAFEDDLMRIGDPMLRLLRALYRLALGRKCKAPGCAAVIFEGRLRYCAGCLRVSYCSRACQRRAWTHELAPHRQVCASIRMLCRLLCSDIHARA